jgi:hypothetical protein
MILASEKKGRNGLTFKNYNFNRIDHLIENFYIKSKGVEDPNLLMRILFPMLE